MITFQSGTTTRMDSQDFPKDSEIMIGYRIGANETIKIQNLTNLELATGNMEADGEMSIDSDTDTMICLDTSSVKNSKNSENCSAAKVSKATEKKDKADGQRSLTGETPSRKSLTANKNRPINTIKIANKAKKAVMNQETRVITAKKEMIRAKRATEA